MAEMMKTKKKSEMDNFQSASCALDASTKIYAYRVDSVHSDTLKLAGGVGDTNKENEGNKNNTEGKYMYVHTNSYILRRPQNFAKSSLYFCPM